MWVPTKNGEGVNLALVTSIKIVEISPINFEVTAFFNSKPSILATFTSKTAAKGFISRLIDVLNGNKPLGYAFTWLTKPAENKPADSDEKHKNELLQDGQWF